MRVEWTRKKDEGLHLIEVRDCPIEVLETVSRETQENATVENVKPVHHDEWFESALSLPVDSKPKQYMVRNAEWDLALNNAEFLELMSFWDAHGVYAVFTKRSPIAFRASGLAQRSRYRALQNFGFVLEFYLAGPSSAGWSSIVTPQTEMADFAERVVEECASD